MRDLQDAQCHGTGAVDRLGALIHERGRSVGAPVVDDEDVDGLGQDLVGGVLEGSRTARRAPNPGGLWPDEAAEALSARLILDDPTYRPVFLPEKGGRESPFAYSLAVGFAVGGQTVAVVRAVAAFWGVLGIIGIWLLATDSEPARGSRPPPG